MKLSLVFPARNEAESIISVLKGFADYCADRHLDHELIVVNDGSRDETGRLVDDFARTHPNVRVIHHLANQGYGAALRSGFTAATGDFIFLTDSDGQFSPPDLVQTLPLMTNETMVVGYRQARADPAIRRLNAALWGRLIRLLFGLRVRDLNCAWKVFPRSVLNNIRLVSRGAFISVELLYHAKNQGLIIKEIPVSHYARKFGSPTGANPRVVSRAFQELVTFLYQRSRVKPESVSLPESSS